MLTIPSSKSNDPYYRYKRSQIEIIEEKKQIKWLNFTEIMEHLKVDPTHFIKKLKKNLNQNIQFKNDVLLFKTLSIDLESFLEAYIDKYVLCPNCKLPELVNNSCNACGWT